MTDERQPYLGDIIGEPLAPMRMYRTRYEPFDWIVTLKHVVVAAIGVTFYSALLIALLVAMFLAVKPALAQIQPVTEADVRRDCRTDALRYCPGAVAHYLGNPNNPDRRAAIITCMLNNRDRLQGKCSRHLY